METQDGDLYLNAEQAEALEAALAGIDNQHAAELETAKTAQAEALAALQAEKENAIAAVKSDCENEVATLNQRIDALNATIEQLNAQIATFQQQTEQLRQQNADLQAAAQEAEESAGADIDAGEQPAENGAAAPSQPRVSACSSAYNPNLSFQENAKRMREAEQKLRKQAF